MWVLLATVVVLLGLLAGAAYAGYRYDRARASRILPGVRIAGVDVGGMTREQAERALAPLASTILRRPIKVEAVGKVYDLTAQSLGTTVDVDTAVDRALAVTNSYRWPTRVFHRLFHKPVDRTFALPVAHDDILIDAFVHSLATEVHRDPRDAYLSFEGSRVVKGRSKSGRSLRTAAARLALKAAVRGGATTVGLATRTIRPSVSEGDLGLAIIVRVSQNRLYLYDGITLMKSYSVATGQLDLYPTPLGHFEIIAKRLNPTWYNPALDTWGKDEPAIIPPGPDNPLGTRAMDLSAPGIRIHGTPNDASIGHWASHGCIRMHIPDSEDLFDRVSVGTPVIIAY